MSKYVDLEGFKFDLSGLAYILPTDMYRTGEYFMRQLQQLPIADVRKNVRGKWILRSADSGYHTDCICSECKSKHAIGWNYCPNCGADMREKTNEQS